MILLALALRTTSSESKMNLWFNSTPSQKICHLVLVDGHASLRTLGCHRNQDGS